MAFVVRRWRWRGAGIFLGVVIISSVLLLIFFLVPQEEVGEEKNEENEEDPDENFQDFPDNLDDQEEVNSKCNAADLNYDILMKTSAEEINGRNISALSRGLRPSCLLDRSMFQMDFDSSLKRLNLEDNSFWVRAKCCYQHIWRVKTKPDFHISKSSGCTDIIQDVTLIPANIEFLRITCRDKSTEKILYQDQLAHIAKPPKSDGVIDPNSFSVLIFAMKSVSLDYFEKAFPRLMRVLEELNPIPMQGYTSMGDGPWENIYPILTGLPYKGMFSDCGKDRKRKYLDDCALFRLKCVGSKGYHVTFQEEVPEPSLFHLGSRHVRRGFRKNPFHRDLRVLNQGLEWLHLGHAGSNVTEEGCYGPHLSLKGLIQNFVGVADAMENQRHFHWSWTTTLKDLDPRVVDDLLRDMVKVLMKRRLLNDTFLIFVSDEGTIPWGASPDKMGEIDIIRSKLPLLMMIPPKKFYLNFPRLAKKIRMDLLLTPLDLHETLVDLTTPGGLRREKNQSRILSSSPGRSCSEAGISDLYCFCLLKTPVNVTDSHLREILGGFIQEMNKEFSFSRCSRLHLGEILHANSLQELPPPPGPGLTREFFKDHNSSSRRHGISWNATVGDFTVTFTTKPGPVIWEALVTAGQEPSLPSFRRVWVDPSVRLCATNNELLPNCVC